MNVKKKNTFLYIQMLDEPIFIIIIFYVACNCHLLGSSSEICNITNGQCECRNNFGNTKCDQCAHGYFDFPQCTCKYSHNNILDLVM